jgi:hypothetical protein
MLRYTGGLRDSRDVLDVQRSLVSLQDRLASSDGKVSTLPRPWRRDRRKTPRAASVLINRRLEP